MQPMSSLLSMTMVRCTDLTGGAFAPQLGMKELALISVLGITDDGMKCMIGAFPALESIAFHSEQGGQQQHLPQALLQLSMNALVAMSTGKRLSRIDLRGVASIEESSLKAMKACFNAQQALGLAHPEVTVLLSRFKQQSEHTIFMLDQLHFPCFYLLHAPLYGPKAKCKVYKLGRSAGLKIKMSAVQSVAKVVVDIVSVPICLLCFLRLVNHPVV